MNDRERMLMTIACETSLTPWHVKQQIGSYSIWSMFDRLAPQFIPADWCKALDMPLKPGDIVRCKTNRSHKWAISEFIGMAVGNFTCPVYLVREIGGKDECQIANESLDVLRFMPECQLYTGKKKQIYDWAHKAFLPQHNKDADKYRVRCGGVFVKECTVEIWARPHVFGLERRIEDKTEYAQPVKYVITWNSKTRLKDIINEMWAQGFPPEWEWSQTQPTEGMGGCATFTKDDVIRMLNCAIM